MTRLPKKPVVLLASTCWWDWVPVLALGLAEAGCDVSAIHPDRGHGLEAVDAIKQRFVYRPDNPMQALREAIGRVRPDLIVPCDDRAVLHLQHLHALEDVAGPAGASGDRPRSELAALIELSLGDAAGFGTAQSRHKLICLARAMGIAAPATGELRTAPDVDAWMATHGLPAVFKIDGSWGGDGVIVVRTRQAAHAAFAHLSRPCSLWFAVERAFVNRDKYWLAEWRNRPARRVSAQSYIEGRPANAAVFCWKGQVLAGISMEVLQTRYRNGPATIVKQVDRPEMLEAARTLAAGMGMSGFFGLDFVIEARSEVAQLIEMNARPTPSCHLRLGPGRDLVGALVAQLSGQAVAPRCITQAEVIAYFPDAGQAKAGSRDGAAIPAGAYRDVPSAAPALVAELLRRPWPTRGLVARGFLFMSCFFRWEGAPSRWATWWLSLRDWGRTAGTSRGRRR